MTGITPDHLKFIALMRETNVIDPVVQEQARIARMSNALGDTAAMRALTELNNSAAMRAVRELDKLKSPARFTLEDAATEYREQFMRQLLPLQVLIKDQSVFSHLASLEDSLAQQYANSVHVNNIAQRLTVLDDYATSSIAAATAIKLSSSEFDAFKALQDSLDQHRTITDLLHSIRTPWAKIDDLLGSAVGVAEANALFEAAHHRAPFDDRVSQYLRFELGDYRDFKTWTEDDVQDSETRLELYTDLGLREELRDTPAAVLVEAESQVLIHRPAAEILTPFSFRALFISDGQEPFMMAHQALRVLERRLRDVINTEMTRAYGPKWIKSTLKAKIRDDWTYKQEQAVRQGRPQDPLIEYADFTDYEQIITAQAPWEAVFRHIFKRPEDVRESLQRLGPVRVAAYHGRAVLDMDILIVAAEGARLMYAMANVGV